MYSGNRKILLYTVLIINMALTGMVCASRSGSIFIPFQEEYLAQNLTPADNDTAWDPSSVILRWIPSELATKQRLYLGTTTALTAQHLVTDKLSGTAYNHLYTPGFSPGTTYYWRIDTEDAQGTIHTGDLWTFSTISDKASAPEPTHGALGIDPDIPALTWQAGLNASTHRVYFGTTHSAVANGAAYATVFGIGRILYTPNPPLSTDTTYYWRVDEVRDNGAVMAGDIWQFSTRWSDGGMLGAYFNNISLSGTPTMTHIDDTIDFASSSNWPGSSLQTNNFSVRWTGYLTVTTSGSYEFTIIADDKVRLWIDHQLMIDDWTAQSVRKLIVSVPFLAAGETYPITLEYADVQGGGAQIQALWSGPGTNSQQQILSGNTLRPVYTAYNPIPADGETWVRHQPKLQWHTGCKTFNQRVYFGTNFFSVANATINSSEYQAYLAGDNTSWPPPGSLTPNQTYYWRVDEVNDLTWKGDVWSFTTADHYVLDNFETYTDNPLGMERIFETWRDGLPYTDQWGNTVDQGNGTGATVGHLQEPFAEQRIVSHGEQSLPLTYDNTLSPYRSEAERTYWSLINFRSQDGRTLRQLRLDFHGLPSFLGQYIQNGTTYSLTGAGSGIGSQEDHCYCVYGNANGNCTLTARVDRPQTSGLSAQAGLMIRSNLDPDAPQITLALRSDGRLAVVARTAAGQVASIQITESPVGSSRWLRLNRQGSNNNTVIYLEHSSNGADWQPVTDSITLFLSNNAYLGLAVSGQGDDYAQVQANFSQVSGSHQNGTITLQLQTDEDLGITLNTPEDLYVVIQDSSNRTAVITHNNPNAVLQDYWDTWTIPFEIVSGINPGIDLTRIQKFIIGVGNRNNPQLGGTGRVYIDDIGLTE